MFIIAPFPFGGWRSWANLSQKLAARTFAKRFDYRCRCGIAGSLPAASTVDHSAVATAGRNSAACL